MVHTVEDCQELDCPICVEQERQAAEDRAVSLPERAKRFAARKRHHSITAAAAAAAGVAEPQFAPQQQPITDTEGPWKPAPGNLRSAAAALQFILAGNAYFTVRSAKTGVRYTFRVSLGNCQTCSKQQACVCPRRPPYFVNLLTGPENTSDYSYLGMITNKQFRLTRASKMKMDSVPVKAFCWVLEHLVGSKLPPQTEIWHEGRCGRCGRMLTVPESIEAGLGPECAGKVGL